uniref:Neur_chan_LBD domain-containing protein n=1 Tax=Parastrongyloides trichosuri TaxID=131310 RepID=A0A0N5A3L2_PARTI
MNIMHFLFILIISNLPSSKQLSEDCSWRHNLTDIEHVSGRTVEVLENCLYYYLIQKNMESSGTHFESILNSPPEDSVVTITIDHFVIHSVEASKKSMNQFYIHGDLFLKWNDSRFVWDTNEWKIEEFALHDTHHVWTPTFIDETFCSTGFDCITKILDVEIESTGIISARLSFRLPSFCSTNYNDYPEESNDCCIFLSIIESDKSFFFDIQTKKKAPVTKNVVLSVGNDFMINNHEMKEISSWFVEDRKIDVVKVGGLRSQFLRVCIHAYKKMPTLKMALRIPISIATMLMLMAPMFGDLKTQAYVKLITLCLQTICFLYLCSIAPETGFGGKKPKIYSFYEFLVGLSFLNILFTLFSLAMSRIRRNVPPTHNLYLVAKLINRYMCCTEPEPSMNYTRQIDEVMDRGQNAILTPDTNDYRMQWSHIWVALNHVMAALTMCIFIIVLICDIL